MYLIRRLRKIGSARENSARSTYRRGPARFLSREKPQKSHAALHTFVTDTSQTAGRRFEWASRPSDIERRLSRVTSGSMMSTLRLLLHRAETGSCLLRASWRGRGHELDPAPLADCSYQSLPKGCAGRRTISSDETNRIEDQALDPPALSQVSFERPVTGDWFGGAEVHFWAGCCRLGLM